MDSYEIGFKTEHFQAYGNFQSLFSPYSQHMKRSKLNFNETGIFNQAKETNMSNVSSQNVANDNVSTSNI